MKKNVITIAGLVSLLVLSYVGIAQLRQVKKEDISEMEDKKPKLIYVQEREGTGETPKSGQTVFVHYIGRFDEDGKPGKKFDSSLDGGKPFSFQIDKHQVIEGWNEQVKKMRVGERGMVTIPPELAYGSRGIPGVIPPNAKLHFLIEVLAIK